MNESLSPNATALLSALREAPVNPAAVGALKQRVHSRLSASLLGLTPELASDALAASPAPGASLRPSGIVRAVSSKAIIGATLAPVFALGVLSGVAVDRWQSHRRASHAVTAAARVTVPAAGASESGASAAGASGSGASAAGASAALPAASATVLTPEGLALVASSTPDTSASAPDTSASAPDTSASAPAPADSASSLAAERALLDKAREALARGEPSAAMAPLGRHTARFPKGMLAEEREALAVRVLCALGNASAAQSRAEAFHRRFPNSLFTPAVKNAVSAISGRDGEGASK